MPTSCGPGAAAHIERGMSALHAFGWTAARHAFESAAEADPGCAMAYWGQAMSHARPWTDLSPPAHAAGGRAARRAAAAGPPTSRERGYVDAALARFSDDTPASDADRRARYGAAMARVARDAPHDLNAQALAALARIERPDLQDPLEPRSAAGRQARRSAALEGNRETGAWIEERFGSAPLHPGAAHYLLLAYDHPSLAAKGLAAAERYAAVAPPLPHARHVASHVFTRTGRWGDAAAANEAAWAASMATVGPDGFEPADYHGLQWLHYARLQQGRYRLAAGIVDLVRRHAEGSAGPATPGGRDAAGAALADLIARDTLERRAWPEAAGLRMDSADSTDAGLWFARGVGAARAAGRSERLSVLEPAREAVRRLDALAARSGRHGPAEMARLGVQAAIAAALDERDELHLVLGQATALEDGLYDAERPTLLPLPIRELAGDLWLLVDRYEEARREYAAVLRVHPRRARALLGLARASGRLGDTAAAARAYGDLLDVWAGADPDLPELAEARQRRGSPAPRVARPATESARRSRATSRRRLVGELVIEKRPAGGHAGRRGAAVPP